MKIKPKMYVMALADMMADEKSPAETKKGLEDFIKFLEKNRDLKKAKEIIRLAEVLYLKKTSKRKVLIESARKIEGKGLLKSFIKETDIVQEKVDPTLIAGVKISVNNEKQIDFSLKSKLDAVFK